MLSVPFCGWEGALTQQTMMEFFYCWVFRSQVTLEILLKKWKITQLG